MRRFLTSAVAALALCSFGTAAFAADAMMASPKPMMMKSPSHMMMHNSMMSCPKGSMMVKGYKKADGTMVKPYCRKKAM